jgi:hypothetical protein
MGTKVIITKMLGKNEPKVNEFLTEKKAIQYFKEWCDEHNYPYEEGSKESGGCGFDYQIEII